MQKSNHVAVLIHLCHTSEVVWYPVVVAAVLHWAFGKLFGRLPSVLDVVAYCSNKIDGRMWTAQVQVHDQCHERRPIHFHNSPPY